MNDLQTSWKGGVGCKQTAYTHFASISQKKDCKSYKSYRSTTALPRFEELPVICFLSMVCACMMQCKLGGPGTLSHFPHCLLPPIMCCRFYVYEGCALIACMCMQCKEAQDLCPASTHRLCDHTHHEFLSELINLEPNL